MGQHAIPTYPQRTALPPKPHAPCRMRTSDSPPSISAAIVRHTYRSGFQALRRSSTAFNAPSTATSSAGLGVGASPPSLEPLPLLLLLLSLSPGLLLNAKEWMAIGWRWARAPNTCGAAAAAGCARP
jgi:hypothetical protein